MDVTSAYIEDIPVLYTRPPSFISIFDIQDNSIFFHVFSELCTI